MSKSPTPVIVSDRFAETCNWARSAFAGIDNHVVLDKTAKPPKPEGDHLIIIKLSEEDASLFVAPQRMGCSKAQWFELLCRYDATCIIGQYTRGLGWSTPSVDLHVQVDGHYFHYSRG